MPFKKEVRLLFYQLDRDRDQDQTPIEKGEEDHEVGIIRGVILDPTPRGEIIEEDIAEVQAEVKRETTELTHLKEKSKYFSFNFSGERSNSRS